MKLYKLLTEDMVSLGGNAPCKWYKGRVKTKKRSYYYLCSPGVLHAYLHPLQMRLNHVTHVSHTQNEVWEAEGNVVVHDGTKVGCNSLKVVRRLGQVRPINESVAHLAIAKATVKVLIHPRTGSVPQKLFRDWVLSGKKGCSPYSLVRRMCSSDTRRACWAVLHYVTPNVSIDKQLQILDMAQADLEAQGLW